MRKGKVLIIEDNDLNLKLFYDLLTIQNYEVLTLKDPSGLNELIKTEMPDLILMDIQLENVSGIDLIKALKAEESTKHIPIIAVTAFAMKNDEARIMQSGCDLYLSKPVSIENFFEVVNNFVSKKTKV